MKFLRGIAFFVATLAVGEVVRRVLMSGVGQAAAGRLGRSDLATIEGASAAAKEARRAIGFVRSLAEGREKPVASSRAPTPWSPEWIGIARDASEMLLAAGAVLKTVSDFVQEDAKLRRRLASKTTGSS